MTRKGNPFFKNLTSHWCSKHDFKSPLISLTITKKFRIKLLVRSPYRPMHFYMGGSNLERGLRVQLKRSESDEENKHVIDLMKRGATHITLG